MSCRSQGEYLDYDGRTYAGSGEREVELKDGKQSKFTLLKMEELCKVRLMLKFLWMGSTSVTVSAEDLETAVITMHRKLVKSPWTINAQERAYYQRWQGDRHSLYDPD